MFGADLVSLRLYMCSLQTHIYLSLQLLASWVDGSSRVEGGGADSHRGGTEGVMCRSYSHNF